MRRALAVAAITLLTVTGCAESDTDTGTADSPTETASAEPTTPEPAESESETSTEEPAEGEAIAIEIRGDKITPNGQLVEASVGEPVVLRIDSDRAGEFHVHSTPEQMIEFGKGETRAELIVERPGVVDVEEHESGIVVLQLQVS